MNAPAGDIYFNPWDPAFRANPYPHYKPLLAGPPRLLEVFFPMALAARYCDVAAILRDPERFSSVQPKPPEPPDPATNLDLFGGAATVLFSDPPVHTRLRKLASKAFIPRRIKELEPRIREITAGLLDKAEARGEFEVIADLATPLPVMVIAEMLGVPPDRYEIFKHWSDTIVASDNTLPGMPVPDEVRAAGDELRAYFTEEIEKRRSRPGNDLVSVLVQAHEEGERLTAAELLAFVILLLLAGNETTTNLIGNGMLALGRNPGELERLRSHPELMAKAVDEMLRYDGPVQSTVRYPKVDANVNGTTIPAGTAVFVMLAAANRDPAQFSNPETFDIAREPNEHLAFGEHIHYCLGAPLALLEGAVAFGSVLERFPRLRLAQPEAHLSYKGSYFLRGLSSLEMAID